MISPAPIFAVLLLFALQPSPEAVPQPTIIIDRRPPTVERITFDPSNPPPDMPRLHPGEAALCHMNFNCQVQLKYEVIEEAIGAPGSTAGGTKVSVHVRQVTMTLTLHNRIYLPRAAGPRIRAHEEGHRIVNERVYEDAERIAREAALDVLTQVWSGSGSDAGAAAKAATDEAVRHLCDAYLAATADQAHRVGQIYDELTRHGRNMQLAEAEAIRQAFAQYRAEQRELQADSDK